MIHSLTASRTGTARIMSELGIDRVTLIRYRLIIEVSRQHRSKIQQVDQYCRYQHIEYTLTPINGFFARKPQYLLTALDTEERIRGLQVFLNDRFDESPT